MSVAGMQLVRAVRGMHDVLPPQASLWSQVESVARDVLSAYGYEEIRLPLLEKTELFRRSIGEVTDIVEKEMYSFDDRNGDSLSLRPEGTAGCVRAAIENGLLHNQVQRLWYLGPMFRHERPQRGRYRQFHQVGAEAFGMPGPDIDAELILLTARLWSRLGVRPNVELQINSLGTAEERQAYRGELLRYLTARRHLLDTDSSRRLDSNPLRVLDSKAPEMAELIAAAPVLLDFLGEGSRAHFQGVREVLDAAGLSYSLNPHLVRGLDYYSRTVFEWVTETLGAQGTVCAGGRYDALVEQLGGRPTPAIGFALGLERLVAMLQGAQASTAAADLYVVAVGADARAQGLLLAEQVRERMPEVRVVVHCGEGGFKSQFRRADRIGARAALVLGEDELRAGRVSVKPLRAEGEQRSVLPEELEGVLAELLAGATAER